MATPHPIEKWYTGKALNIIREYVLPTLAEAERQGYWPKGASRKVKAALNKQSVARKFALANERSGSERNDSCEGLLDDVCSNRSHPWESDIRAWPVVRAMMFGFVGEAPECLTLADTLVPHCRTDAEREALATARGWAADFAPVAELMALLDATRPAPVIVLGSVSPTVLANVGKSMGVDFSSIRVPEIEWSWRWVTLKDGSRFRTKFGVIKWPPGTRHHVSRFACGSRVAHARQARNLLSTSDFMRALRKSSPNRVDQHLRKVERLLDNYVTRPDPPWVVPACELYPVGK